MRVIVKRMLVVYQLHSFKPQEGGPGEEGEMMGVGRKRKKKQEGNGNHTILAPLLHKPPPTHSYTYTRYRASPAPRASSRTNHKAP